MATVQLKAPRTTEITATAPKFVSFLHPAESARYNVILRLPCLDSLVLSQEGQQQEQEPKQQHLGLHHETALLACQIVANNAFDGYLSLIIQGNHPVSRTTIILTAAECKRVSASFSSLFDNRLFLEAPESLINHIQMSITDPESLDYFIVPGDPLYATVPAFQDWEFPHGRIPDSFPSLTVSQQPDEMKRHQQASRHPRCAVTNSAYSCQQAHLIPKAHEAWFSKNAMIMALDQSNRMRGIDGSGNLCHFRFDIHNALDNFVFALVYKASSWVIHVLQTSKDGAWDEFA